MRGTRLWIVAAGCTVVAFVTRWPFRSHALFSWDSDQLLLGAVLVFLAGLAVLELSQLAGLLALHTFASHSGLTARVSDVRGWAVAGPLLIVVAVVHVGRARR